MHNYVQDAALQCVVLQKQCKPAGRSNLHVHKLAYLPVVGQAIAFSQP